MFRPLISALSLALVSSAVFAAGADPAAAANSRTGTLAFTGGLKLQKLYHDVGSAGGAAIPAATITPYGSTLNISCTNAAGCYIIVNANVQIGAISTVNPAAMTIKVNGLAINSPYNTPIGTTSFTVMSYQTGISVPVGNHVVTTEVFVNNAATLYRYNTEVKLYKV